MLKPLTAEPIQFLDREGKPTQTFDLPLTEADLKRLYYLMALTRGIDERAWTLVRQGKAFFYAMTSGQEAAQVGSAFCLTTEDWAFPSHRSLGLAITKGMTPFEIFSQILGKAADFNKGHQMPNHLGKRSVRLVTPSSVVGNKIPEAVGTGYAAKLRGNSTVSIVYFGEGAASQGDFHVGMNFAGVFKTPTIFFCENNQYAISMPVKHQAAVEAISMEACGYGFDGFRVDGNDIVAVYLVTQAAVARARSGGGPTLIEALTYRYGPHSSADDERRYRPAEEVAEWKERRDPIKRLAGYLKYRELWTEAWQNEIDLRIKNEVETALAQAEATPDPMPETLFADVFAEIPWHLLQEQERARSGFESKSEGM
jgi:TPP-dependent pyruvate/acetoin dehydrogenase alpha subunit